MPLLSEIVQRVGADNSAYRSVMNQSERVAEETGNRIMKKLDIRAGVIAVAAAIGFSVEKIYDGLARLATGVSADTEEAFKKMEEAAKSSTDAQLQAMHGLLDAEQQYLLALRNREAALKRIGDNAPRGDGEAPSFAFRARAAIGGFLAAHSDPNSAAGVIARRLQQTNAEVEALKHKAALDAEAQEVAQNEVVIHQHDLVVQERRVALDKASYGYGMASLTSAGRLRVVNSEIADIQAEIAAGGEAKRKDEQLGARLQDLELARLKEMDALTNARTLSLEQQKEVWLLQAKGSERLTENEGIRLALLKQEEKQLENNGKIEDLLAIPASKRTEAEKETLRYLVLHSVELKKEADIIAATAGRAATLFGLQSGTLVLVKDQLGNEKAISAEKVRQLEAVNAQNEMQGKMNLLLNDTIILMGKAYGTSRNPTSIADASDAALEAMIKKNMAEISDIEANKGRGLTAGADAATGYLPQGIVQARLQTDINRAQYQLDLRRNLRSDVQQLGVDGARARFGGDPLQFDALISQVVGVQSQIATGLSNLNQQLTKGLPVQLFGDQQQ